MVGGANKAPIYIKKHPQESDDSSECFDCNDISGFGLSWGNLEGYPLRVLRIYVHLWKDAEERKNARIRKDFGHCENMETMFALAKL